MKNINDAQLEKIAAGHKGKWARDISLSNIMSRGTGAGAAAALAALESGKGVEEDPAVSEVEASKGGGADAVELALR